MIHRIATSVNQDLAKIEQLIQCHFDWHLGSFSIVRIVFSDDSSFIGVDLPTDIEDECEIASVIDSIESLLREKLEI